MAKKNNGPIRKGIAVYSRDHIKTLGKAYGAKLSNIAVNMISRKVRNAYEISLKEAQGELNASLHKLVPKKKKK